MEVATAINEINKGTMNTDEILEPLELEKFELEKKIHLIKFTSLFNKFSELINNGDFQKKNIKTLYLGCRKYDNISEESGHYLSYLFKDTNENNLNGSDYKYIYDIFDVEFKRFKNVNKSLLGLINEYNLNIVFNQSFKQNLSKSLLSKELQSALMYSELQNEINNNEATTAKIKL